MKGTLKIRPIGNSTGAIFPKYLHAKVGTKVPYTFKNGHLDIDLSYATAKKRAKFINDAFKDSDYPVSERQLEREFSGWGPRHE